MGNLETISAITDNLKNALRAGGIFFTKETYDDERSIPASLIPLGQILYLSQTYEQTHGQRPGYAEASFAVKVVITERDSAMMMREQQRWLNAIADVVCVNGLNVGALSGGKPVTWARVRGVEVEQLKDNRSVVRCRVAIRYRQT